MSVVNILFLLFGYLPYMVKAQLRPIYPSEFQQPQLQPSRSTSVGRTATSCPIAPIGCTLNCPHGFAWGVPGGPCLCICQLDPCFSTICGLGEVCVSNKDSTKCVSLVPRRESTSVNTARPNASGRNSSNSDSTIGECPRLLGGLCVNRCRIDSECESSQKCCYNGCGHECVQPVNVAPIRGSLLIQPLLGQTAAGRSESPEVRRPVIQPALTPAPAISGTSFLSSGSKPGQCPSATSLKDKRCGVECNRDDDCKGVTKCCANGCGRICAPPEKSTACVHLLSAVERLPQRILINGFVPSCSSSGHFNPVQCDSEFCWCVDPESGHEIFGTKLQRAERASLNCREPRYCALSECMATCPFGVQTDDRGCPVEGCICKDTCQSVKCEHKFDQCQLVEPDCSKPPCAPVPRCFLNPCPSGAPMSLTNGVTALCQQSTQCWDGFWCHQVGYNGLGFCCPVPESATRPGLCPSKTVQSNHRISSQDCSSECKNLFFDRVDADCASPAKCCFDGCGLKCTLPTSVDLPSEEGKVASHVKQERPTWDAERNNKRVIAENPKLALCPASLNNVVGAENGEECIAECRKNEDCLGLRKCCAVGCSRLCLYPQTTTKCLHQAISHEIYKLKRSPLKCNSEGDFEEIQCNDEYCYCVHTKTGEEKPNGRVPPNRQPNCENTISCAIPQCSNRCPHGYMADEKGCQSCKCQNKCDGIRCERGQICVMADVDCLEGSKCSAQPRCIANICQFGSPFVAAHRFVEQCHKECPVGFWCNKIGLPGAGGLCCPVNSKSHESELSSAIALVSQQHRGECVKQNVDVNRKECRLRSSPICRLDSDCSSNEKCCFDGCDTSCVPIMSRPDAAFPTPSPNGIQIGREDTEHNKIGVCPALSKSQRSDCRSGTDQCSSDSDCPTILKCCSDGCYKRCVYAQRNTPCLHLKAASELLDIKRAVQCSKDGNFEDIQCNNEFCWCVETFSGYEIQGTRVSSTRTPECDAPQKCPDTYCNSPKRCPYGYEKDSNGCNTCECVNPCKDVECPNPDRICLPEPVDCLNTKGHCTYHVPKCVVNVCIVREALLLRESTRRPEFCKRSSDCPEANHCRLVNNDNGFCCYGPEPRTNSGKCPRVPEWALIQPADPLLCELKCTQDSDCEKSNQKCCFNGCGLACTHTTQHSDEQTVETGSYHKIANAATQSLKKIGQCAKVEPLTSAELCKGSPKDMCSEDNECPGNRLCCFDGCMRTCLYPEITTNCLHAQAAADVIARLAPSNIFQPLCTKDGSFERIQRHSGMAWCVDSNGNEIYGTKTMSTLLSDCDALKKKSCPIAPCQKNCRFGYVTDLSGCQQCICKDPCIDAKCPMNTICRMTPVKCLNNAANCTPVAKCILNVCIRGEPLEGTNRELITCDEQKGPKCPNGWYCNKFGLENHGYCCPGLVPLTRLQQSAEQCPYMPIMFGHDSRPANVKCRFSEECAANEPCCFNGLGMSCFPAPKDTSRERDLTRTPNRSAPKSVGVISSSSSSRSASQCPANVGFINPGCAQECATDEDCHLKSQFMKCCDYSCGRRCIFSNQLTACVHLQAAHIREADKMANIPTSLGRPTVLCSPEGRFMRVQCDVSIK
ncbi:WAP-type (Whey acidic protein) 'four-disulfide core' domain-containing protein [Ditylenchus destructor]|uniref:WAP-type (Whey acidic protein) 'four-disulfide core' domain-containing protein n=1 Tax=Ditylenchus destructor TaxID=166010 RepID=A0AAD4NFX7_9BILA|nr:WAP-type (Whey acidic protein) 'four-disulfide core' domain-containing protein [Ditylenchus destructor]